MHGLAEVEEAARSERLQAWVASISSPGPRAAAALPPPLERVDLSRTQLFSSWEVWTQFLIAPPALPALSRVLDAVVRIARLVDVRAPVNAPAIVAAITRANEHRHELPHARDSLLTLKFLAVTDALQHLYSRVPKPLLGNKELDLSAVASFARANSGLLSRAESENTFDKGFVRVTSEHFPNVPKEIAEFAEAASLSLEGSAPSALRMNFESVLSLGRSEPSTNTIGGVDDVGPVFSATNKCLAAESSTPMVHASSSMNRNRNVAESWSAFALNAPSKVEEAAGHLYSSVPLDDLWIIGDAIGAGSFSDVHHVTCAKDGTRAAIKIVCKGAPDLFTADGACREVAAFGRIGHHDSVVNCLQVFEDDRFVYIVMELLTGGQLIPRVSDASHYGMYSETDARNYAYGIARGLAHCHSLGIAHRDVKPDNILFVSENDQINVKLTDFGIAHIMQSGEEGAMDMVGTPLYVAPEVLLQRPYGCAADMWSLGVIVHILLTGFPPFDDDNVVVLINKVKSRELAFDDAAWADVSPDAKDFVVRLLCRNPEERLSATEALSHPWLEPLQPAERKNSERLSHPPRQQSLQSVQTNLRSFANRKDSRPHIGSSHKLSLLVSLSERKLKASSSSVSNRFSVEGRRLSGQQYGRPASMTHSNVRPIPTGSAVFRQRSTPVRAQSPGSDEKKGKLIGSPRRRPIRGKGRTDVQESQRNHSEFQPSYAPTEDSTTEKLHEMVDISSARLEFTPASPKAVPSSTPMRPPSPAELSGKTAVNVTAVSTSLSTTTTTPPVSGKSLKPAPGNGECDDMDQSNVLYVKVDESLRDRRQANAELDSPARRAKTGLLRVGARSSRKRSKSVTRDLRIFRKVHSQTQK